MMVSDKKTIPNYFHAFTGHMIAPARNPKKRTDHDTLIKIIPVV